MSQIFVWCQFFASLLLCSEQNLLGLISGSLNNPAMSTLLLLINNLHVTR